MVFVPPINEASLFQPTDKRFLIDLPQNHGRPQGAPEALPHLESARSGRHISQPPCPPCHGWWPESNRSWRDAESCGAKTESCPRLCCAVTLAVPAVPTLMVTVASVVVTPSLALEVKVSVPT